MPTDPTRAAGQDARDILAPSSKPIAAAPFRTRECALFAELYKSLQREAGRIVPPRTLFRPAAARAFLPFVTIFEIREPRLALVRLVGTAIVNRARIDCTGRNMMDLFPPEERDWYWSHFERVIGTPCGATFLSTEGYGQASILIEVVSFPFSDAGGEPRLILSLSVEVNRPEFDLRGDQMVQTSKLTDHRYFDIGAGV